MRKQNKKAAVERRTLRVENWPQEDKLSWRDACRPSYRLVPGGRAAYLALASREDFERRYGLFLGFLKRANRLDMNAPAATQVTIENVKDYIAEITPRVSSVTVYNCIYKLRRAAELIAPELDFGWLAEIEKDLALVMIPKSKFDRLVLAAPLVEAGLTLMTEASNCEEAAKAQALGIRDGLMLALWPLFPFRRKNFGALEIGTTFSRVRSTWWITLTSDMTKERRADERRIHDWLIPYVEEYLNVARPILLNGAEHTDALWISSTGRPMSPRDVGKSISKVTVRTVGVNVSPHLFRTSAATTASLECPTMPHLASALLDHTDPRVTEKNYIRKSSIQAAQAFAALIRKRRGLE
jgi:hypothetical protein